MYIQVSITIGIKWNLASSLFCRCMHWKFHLHKYMETEGISASTVNFLTTFGIICQKSHDELSLKITGYDIPTNKLI